MSHFGDRLRKAFSNAKNAEIARKLGVSESAVTNYVNGRIPDADKLIQIANLTNCDLHWLLTGEEKLRIGKIEAEPGLEEVFERRMREIVHEELGRELRGEEEVNLRGGLTRLKNEDMIRVRQQIALSSDEEVERELEERKRKAS